MVIEANGRTGRRPGVGVTKQAILDAARILFIQHGYDGATVRGIASQAGTDPKLIRYFFGGKEGLFAAAMDLPPGVAEMILATFDHAVDEWGERLTRTYLTVWEDPATAAPLRAMLVSAFTNDQALERFRSFLVSSVLESASQKLNESSPGLRLSVSMSHLVGIAVSRYIVQAPPICAASIDELTKIVGPTIQQYLTGPMPDEA